MRVLIAPQEFKGSLTAREAAQAMAEGVRLTFPDSTVDVAPMSDGGAGLVDALLSAAGGERIETLVHDPLMRSVAAGWAVLPSATAAIEMAAASGLMLLAPNELDPRHTTTYGTGELIRAALDRECRRIIVGVGGSATIDAGAGAMQALGARLIDQTGAELRQGGAALLQLERIDLSRIDPRLAKTGLIVASDVTNTLCGPQGAARMFGPQKGASPEDVDVLDAALSRFADIVLRQCGTDIRETPGSGAAGGLGAGLVAISARARIMPGFDIVAGAVQLERRVAAADLVLTGEGRLDDQTPFGKTAAGMARMARAHDKPAGVVAGIVRNDFDRNSGLFDVIEAASDGLSPEEAIQRAGELVRAAAARATARLQRLHSERR
jgi:glycerate kinase